MANQLVVIDGFQPVTDSRTVAEYFEKDHLHVLRDIRTLVKQMASERHNPKLVSAMFTETSYQAEDGGRRYPTFKMNRDGFSLLAMGFTGKKALKFKLRFINAFNKMEAKLKQLAVEGKDERWLETRNNTKASHKPFTAAIQLLVAYLRQFGDTRNETFFYGHITNIIQNACAIVKGDRDFAPSANLNKCDQFQSMTANLILNLITQRRLRSLCEFDAAILAHINQFNHLLGGQLLLSERIR